MAKSAQTRAGSARSVPAKRAFPDVVSAYPALEKA